MSSLKFHAIWTTLHLTVWALILIPVDECVEPELFFNVLVGMSLGEYLEPELFAFPADFGAVSLVSDLRGRPLPFLLVVNAFPPALVLCDVFSLGMASELLKSVTKNQNKSKIPLKIRPRVFILFFDTR